MKPTTEHIITALRDGVSLRTDLCDRLGCTNAALTKVIRNMLDRDLIARELDGKDVAYYLTAKGREWVPGMQSARVRAAAKAPNISPAAPNIVPAIGDSEGGETDVEVAAELQAKSDEVSSAIDVKPDASAALANANALIDKLQSLLTSKTHECEALRAQMAHACNGGCKPDMETVPLADLIQHVALFLDDGISLTIYNDTVASVQAFGKSFVCTHAEANGVLDASAMLARLEVEA